MKTLDWSRPQRQPLAGLAIVFINVLWEIIKRVWPFLILIMLQNKPGKVDKYEIIALIFVVFTVTSAVLKFFFFRFYIEDNKLIIKRGWIKKVTQIIPLERIQTVNIEQGPVHQVMNIVKLSIDTAGSERTETRIDALHKTMAEALKEQLLSNKGEITTEQPVSISPPFLQLNGTDLLKLSLSANHLETLALIFSFVFGLYENFKGVAGSFFSDTDDYLKDLSLSPVFFLVFVGLLITILVSTARIFFTFYDFKVTPVQKGLRIKSGLLNVKERLIAFQKIQFVSWKANWIRKMMGLWMLEYHITGGDDIHKKSRVHLPVTRNEFVPLLTKEYHPVPQLNEVFIKMHPSYLWRRILFVALLPTLILFIPLWLMWHYVAFYLFFYTALATILSWAKYRKFRLWCLEDVAFIRQGWFGQEWILLRWYKIQSVQMRQTIFQRKKGLASLKLYTAAGVIVIPFINKNEAYQVMDYALYKIESTRESWM